MTAHALRVLNDITLLSKLGDRCVTEHSVHSKQGAAGYPDLAFGRSAW
jgi:hypothetical protein